MKKRIAQVERVTKETQIKAEINLDGQGDSSIKAGLPFLEHMLEQVARHGMFDLKLLAKGDLEIDAHHTVEDVGIVLGQALEKALGNKIGITRFGSAYVPLDESLSRVVVASNFFWQAAFLMFLSCQLGVKRSLVKIRPGPNSAAAWC